MLLETQGKIKTFANHFKGNWVAKFQRNIDAAKTLEVRCRENGSENGKFECTESSHGTVGNK